jgi:hypothetical protein
MKQHFGSLPFLLPQMYHITHRIVNKIPFAYWVGFMGWLYGLADWVGFLGWLYGLAYWVGFMG